MRPSDPADEPSTSSTESTWEMDMPSMPRPGPDATASGAGSPGAEPAPAPAGVATLVIRRGPEQGSSYTVGSGTTTLGRDRNCDVVLDDVTVSRRHAEIHHAGGRLVLVDSGSLNGTYVNRVASDRANLVDGDEIWVGKFRMTLHTDLPTQ